ncbi:hypothetical protein AVEN_109956-1 [Araneus ventricosus]|uniref:Uncharacterized protein n=1 Tax=Araneus ventricosus TaxID=182803 RepID=A0A4Y2WT67_ARAVE|nr:hypothetical protein AVEN_175790-1 [Araneus ventricosus]GBO40480.1 hypothetical protein AVEN_213451-1 [Araneus ventricosus]GBO40588.1 hypothetical protein AVEN_234070-1 [Araneus ventricosus]GBO40593.1 hypothetical protein AVEN_109956-1 [Araneus ventricosus]
MANGMLATLKHAEEKNENIATTIHSAYWILLQKSPRACTVKTSNKQDNGALFTNIQERRNTGNRKNTELTQFSNTSKQQVTNNSNSTNNSAQRLAADQLAMRTRLQRDSLLPVESYCRAFIVFPTGRDVT